MTSEVLAADRWRARAVAYRARVERWTVPHRERRRRGEPHPVLDCLFTYYSLPQRLEQWHPGPGVVLHGGDAYLATPGYVRDADGVRLDPAALPGRIAATARFVRELLVATASRPAIPVYHGPGPELLRARAGEGVRGSPPAREGDQA